MSSKIERNFIRNRESFPMPDPNSNAPAMDEVVLRPMTTDDLPFAHALSAELHWPHRPADWAQVFAHAEGIVADHAVEVLRRVHVPRPGRNLAPSLSR
jgi:hypothetical protein